MKVTGHKYLLSTLSSILDKDEVRAKQILHSEINSVINKALKDAGFSFRIVDNNNNNNDDDPQEEEEKKSAEENKLTKEQIDFVINTMKKEEHMMNYQ